MTGKTPWSCVHNSEGLYPSTTMDEAYLALLAAVPIFVSRSVLPLFAASLWLRSGQSLDHPLLREALSALGLPLPANVPAWATHDSALWILAGMSLWEVLSQRVPELRELSITDRPLVKAVAFAGAGYVLLTSTQPGQYGATSAVGVLDAASSSSSVDSTFTTILTLGKYLWLALLASVTGLFATVRDWLHQNLTELDPGDDLRLRAALNWLEDCIGLLGLFCVLILPLFSAIVGAAALLGLWLVQRTLAYHERKRLRPCPTCRAPMQSSALFCGTCQASNPAPMQLGLLGLPSVRPFQGDPDQQRHALLRRHRCPRCATRLARRTFSQRCTLCGTEPFPTARAQRTYVQNVSREMPRALVLSTLMGLVPAVGFVAGLIYYRLQLISPLRAYISRTRHLLVRILMTGVGSFLLLLQLIPGLGALVLPIMCYCSYRLCRQSLHQQFRDLPTAGSQS